MPHNFIRHVAYSEEQGVYLGECLGLGFWSKLDPAGQDSATTFATPQEFWDLARTWETPPPTDTVTRPVVCADPQWAAVGECEATGLPKWEVKK